MSTPLEAFGSQIDLNASKVLNFPSVIFLCGGPIETGSGIQHSLRGIFYERLKLGHPNLFQRVVLAEDANRWSRAAEHYDQLLALENDLAYLSAVIMLFVESPGSIAELGAFSNVLPLRKKLVAILEHSYQDEESFIQDGPVASLKKYDSDSVMFYPWLGRCNEHGNRPLERDRALETVDCLLEWLCNPKSSIVKEEKFNPEDAGHCILLVADLVKLGVIVTISEISVLLAGVGLENVCQHLKKYLFLLEKLKLIAKTQYGNHTYYLSLTPPNEFVRYSLKLKDRATDRLRLKYDLSQAMPFDRDRKKAHEFYLKKLDGKHE